MFAGADGTIVEKNEVRGNDLSGIWVDGEAGVLVSGNTSIGNREGGIHLTRTATGREEHGDRQSARRHPGRSAPTMVSCLGLTRFSRHSALGTRRSVRARSTSHRARRSRTA